MITLTESLQNYGSPHSSVYQTLSAFWLAVRATRTHKFPFHNHKEADTSVDKTPASKWPIHQPWKSNQQNQPASGFESTYCQAKSQLLGQNAHLWQHLTPVYQTLLVFWLAERMWESPKVRQPTGERQSHKNQLACKTQPVGPTEPRVSRIHRLFCHVRGFTCLNQQKKKVVGLVFWAATPW